MNPIFQGDKKTAYRDPACYYHNGVYYLFYTLSEKEDGYMYNYVAMSRSRNLTDWTSPRILTPKDKGLNYCSPGNVLSSENDFIICFSSYPLREGFAKAPVADESARLFVMRTKDFEEFSPPELLKVKGNIPEESMGRMIDPFIFEDKDEAGKYWAFYKQNGVSMSYSYNLRDWTFCGNIDGGENASVIVEEDRYILFHSPENGIGIKASSNLSDWRDEGVFYLGQRDWRWASGRITAGFIMRAHEDFPYRYILFFHGSTADSYPEIHGEASLGVAFTSNLKSYSYELDI